MQADVGEMTVRLPMLATYCGTSHLDDVFAYAVLRLALRLREAGWATPSCAPATRP